MRRPKEKLVRVTLTFNMLMLLILSACKGDTVKPVDEPTDGMDNNPATLVEGEIQPEHPGEVAVAPTTEESNSDEVAEETVEATLSTQDIIDLAAEGGITLTPEAVAEFEKVEEGSNTSKRILYRIGPNNSAQIITVNGNNINFTTVPNVSFVEIIDGIINFIDNKETVLATATITTTQAYITLTPEFFAAPTPVDPVEIAESETPEAPINFVLGGREVLPEMHNGYGSEIPANSFFIENDNGNGGNITIETVDENGNDVIINISIPPLVNLDGSNPIDAHGNPVDTIITTITFFNKSQNDTLTPTPTVNYTDANGDRIGYLILDPTGENQAENPQVKYENLFTREMPIGEGIPEGAWIGNDLGYESSRNGSPGVTDRYVDFSGQVTRVWKEFHIPFQDSTPEEIVTTDYASSVWITLDDGQKNVIDISVAGYIDDESDSQSPLGISTVESTNNPHIIWPINKNISVEEIIQHCINSQFILATLTDYSKMPGNSAGIIHSQRPEWIYSRYKGLRDSYIRDINGAEVHQQQKDFIDKLVNGEPQVNINIPFTAQIMTIKIPRSN